MALVHLDLSQSVAKFRLALLRWYDRHRRDLPWRVDPLPYRTWISEIMLQQTRVAAVLEPYGRFLKRFPDVHVLARARAETVLAAWSGLGYYRRARLMHQAARVTVRDRGGRFPQTAEQWLELPGIGRYTAAAIASICHGERCAVVDGNVERVVRRLLGEKPADPWEIANELLSRRRPGDFNQAIMELGATVCTPRSPKCPECPVQRWCRSAVFGAYVHEKSSAKPRGKVTSSCALLTHGERVLLVRRPAHEAVMPGMWELPPATLSEGPVRSQFTVRHAIMNTDYVVRVIRKNVRRGRTQMGADGIQESQWFSPRRASSLPLTGLTRKILKRAEII